MDFEEQKSVVILKSPKSMLKYYLLKVFTLFECNTINLEKLPDKDKDRIHAEDTYNSDKVVMCITTIPSTSNTLKNLAVNKNFIVTICKEN